MQMDRQRTARCSTALFIAVPRWQTGVHMLHACQDLRRMHVNCVCVYTLCKRPVCNVDVVWEVVAPSLWHGNAAPCAACPEPRSRGILLIGCMDGVSSKYVAHAARTRLVDANLTQRALLWPTMTNKDFNNSSTGTIAMAVRGCGSPPCHTSSASHQTFLLLNPGASLHLLPGGCSGPQLRHSSRDQLMPSWSDV